MNMWNNSKTDHRHKKLRQSGFTLVELMYATVLGVIILMSAGAVIVSTWRESSEFIKESLTMQDVNLIGEIFKKHVRADTITYANVQSNQIVFTEPGGSITASLREDKDRQSLIYEKDGVEFMSFDGMILSFNAQVFTNVVVGSSSLRSLYTLSIDVIEAEINKTNSFTFQTASRVEFDQ